MTRPVATWSRRWKLPPEKASSYGIVDIAEDMGALVRAKGMVEKPQPQDAPSNLAVIGRYILTPKVLTNLNRMKQGAGGEIQLTDAIAEEVGGKDGVHGLRFRGQRYDCGSKIGLPAGHRGLRPGRGPTLRGEFRSFPARRCSPCRRLRSSDLAPRRHGFSRSAARPARRDLGLWMAYRLRLGPGAGCFCPGRSAAAMS